MTLGRPGLCAEPESRRPEGHVHSRWMRNRGSSVQTAYYRLHKDLVGP
jgi:hypothetical protein